MSEIIGGVPQKRGSYDYGCICSRHRYHRECSNDCPCGRWRGNARKTKLLFHRLAEVGLLGGETTPYGVMEWRAAGTPGRLRSTG